MKHVLFILGLLIAAFIALKVFFWALGKIVLFALIAGAIYIGARMLIGKKSDNG
ncbi:MAG: hypothetical protein M5R41_18565 [Bacteroidia bacterium]|nr:hypothetical protein [Bacteroidia bacterium]